MSTTEAPSTGTPDQGDPTNDSAEQARLRGELEEERSRRLAAEDENRVLKYDNAHDVKTGMQTRTETLRQAQTYIDAKQPFLLLFLDGDHIKDINDDPNLGHLVVDGILEKIAPRIHNKYRRATDAVNLAYHQRLFDLPEDDERSASLGRYGGDEIIALIPVNIREGEEITLAEAADRELKYAYGEFDNFSNEQDPAVLAKGFGFSKGADLYDPANPKSLPQILATADQRMLENKRERHAERQ